MPDYTKPEDYNHLQDEIIIEEAGQAEALGNLIIGKIEAQSIIDVGCGPGIYLLPFKKAGYRVLGIDWCGSAGKVLGEDEFEIVDLRYLWTPYVEYDIALCLEVAEHIQPEFTDTFMDTLAGCAPLCFFSAAGPAQGGCGHFNCQEKEYWIKKFSDRGFVLDKQLTDEIHALIDHDPVYWRCMWLIWNLMVFRYGG